MRCYSTTLMLVWAMPGASAEDTGPAAGTVTRCFQETDALFANPGKGWLANRRLPRREPRFPAAVAYFRLNWGDIELQEGAYQWKLIDEAIAAWGKRNVRIALRQLQCGVDVTAWTPGDYRVAGRIDIPAKLAADTYTLAVGLVDPVTEASAIRLAIESPLTGRYHHIGTIQVE